MKNIFKYLAFCCCIILYTSCLDESPISKIGEDDFYKTTEDINQAVIACYNGMQKTISNEWPLTEVRSDNARHYGWNSTNEKSVELYALNNFRISASNSLNEKYWEACYHNIANCNTVYKHIDIVTNEELKKQFEGEASFIRAYHYFNLVRLYGPLFIVTQRIEMKEAAKYERNSVEEVYKFITSELETILSDKKIPDTFPNNEKGRADLWAVKMLLAKVYFTQNRFTEAKNLLIDIKENSPYKLLTGNNAYAKVFSISNEMNEEIIFTIRFKAGGLGLGSRFANAFAPNNSSNMVVNSGGDGDNCPTNNLITSYESNDLRKDVSLAETWVNPTGQTVYLAYCKKYLSAVSIKYDAENDWPIFRFADVLLTLGEIENELSGPTAGLPYLNEIRVRAGLTELTTTQIQNKYDFRMAIENERRHEFAFENHRFFDLLRTGRLKTIMENQYETELIPDSSTGELKLYYNDPTKSSYLEPNLRKLEDWQLLLPIPYNVINVSDNATQNMGY